MGLALEEHRGTIGFAASGGLHLLVALLLILSVSRQPPAAIHDRDPIEIEIVPGDEAAPVAAPPDRPRPLETVPPPAAALPDLSARPPVDLPLTAPPQTAPPGWITAPRLYSPQAFARPGNRATHQHILAMPADLRDEQLCDFEAMEQVARANAAAHPDQVVAYAMADTRTEGRALVAEGAAIRLGGKWFRLAFRCEVGPKDATVVAFAYRLGAAIPRRLWSELGLAAGGDD